METTLIPYHACQGLPAKAVLVLAPHPDDEVFGCAGAVIRHVQKGCSVSIIVLSDGAYGAADQTDQVIATREAESCAAAVLMGCSSPIFWRLPDRGLAYGEVLIGRVMAAIEAAGADLVYAPALTEMHPDHRAVGMVAVEAVRRLGAFFRLAMYEVGVPLSPNVLLDISTQSELKFQAMQCFASQLKVQAYDAHIAALNRFRTYTLPATVSMAEAYCVHDGDELSRSFGGIFDSEYVRQSRLGLAMVGSRDLPLVSMIVCSTSLSHLEQTLDSLSLQTYPNIEVVVVNTIGSVPARLGIHCGRFPMRVVSTNSVVQTSAMSANTGVNAATGDFLVVLGDGAYTLDANHVASLMSVTRSHAPNSVVAYSGVRPFSSQSCNNQTNTSQIIVPTELDTIKLLMLGTALPVHALLFPRAFCIRGLVFDEALASYEVWDFWLQLSELAPLEFSGCTTATDFKAPQITNATRAQIFEKWSNRISGHLLHNMVSMHADLQTAHAEAVRRFKQTVSQQAQHTLEVENRMQKHDFQLAETSAALQGMLNSTSWRLTRPIRFVGRRLLQLHSLVKRLLT